MDSYTITLNAEHMQVLSSALIELPYRIVAPVIAEINRQVSEAMNRKPEAAADGQV